MFELRNLWMLLLSKGVQSKAFSPYTRNKFMANESDFIIMDKIRTKLCSKTTG